MKKLLVLMMALMTALCLAACSGEATEPASSESATTLVSKEVNLTSLLVPSDFGDFTDKDGNAVAEGPSSNIIVTGTNQTDVSLEDITEEYALSLMENSYSNIEVLSFENPATIAGVNSMLIHFTGDGIASGKNRTVCYIMLFFTIDGINCEQHIAFTYDTEASSSLEANLNDIINSISLG